MGINPGTLNKRITIQTKTNVADGYGSSTTTWVDTISVWAAMWPISANETIKNDKLRGDVTHRIRIWYRTGVTYKNRIKWGTKYYQVIGIINPNEENVYLDLLCKEYIE